MVVDVVIRMRSILERLLDAGLNLHVIDTSSLHGVNRISMCRQITLVLHSFVKIIEIFLRVVASLEHAGMAQVLFQDLLQLVVFGSVRIVLEHAVLTVANAAIALRI